jgi:hypothetical protein
VSAFWAWMVFGIAVLVQLRALMSAADAASAWDLRCDVREHIVGHLRREHPQALPRLRAEVPADTRPA